MDRTIALGAFDGLHAAHRAVLRGANAVLLFNEHPQKLLRGRAPPQLLSDAERDTRLRAAGLELLKIPFEEIAGLSPITFFSEILCKRYHVTALRCGHDYRFGAHAEGDAALLKQLCGTHGVDLAIVPRVIFRGEDLSSSRIRAALLDGRTGEANAMLGRAFGYAFEVVHGARVGHILGTPTLNQRFPEGFIVPRFGVYASRAFVDGAWRAGLTNIGRRPTFDRDELRSETHILRFSGDLYGKRVPVRLLNFIREERRFETMEALKAQIQIDLKEILCHF